jgi:quinolinate synthase
MAETAKIISPEKKVLIPDKNSGCPMADMVTAKDLSKLKEKHPDAVVVCYVNSTAEVKALSDICCTSSNAVKVIESIDPKKEIIFIPDKYLGSYVSKKTGRDLIFWDGYCPTHVMMSAKKLIEVKKEHLDAELIVHPESTPEVIELADSVESTGGMLRYVKKSKSKKFIIGTEIGMLHRLRKENPDKIFISPSNKLICPNMKLINVEKIFWSLEEEQYEIELEENIIKEARSAIDRMLEIT